MILALFREIHKVQSKNVQDKVIFHNTHNYLDFLWKSSEVPSLEPGTSQFQSKNDTSTQNGLKQKCGRISSTIYLIQISRVLSIMIEIEDFCILFILDTCTLKCMVLQDQWMTPEFLLNGTKISEFRESDKSMKYELGPV